jgi:hypothetical protein
MPSVSTAQQQLMGMAYALKKGDMDPADASQEVKDLADSLSMQQLKDFAETKHEGLPKHVEKSRVNEWLPGVSAGHKWYTQTAQAAASYNYQVSDHKDNLVKSYIEFIESGKKPTKKSTFEIKENGGAVAPTSYSSVQATPNNTPGMGNVSPAGPGKIGSGDVFSNGNPEDDDDDKKLALVLNFDKFMKTVAKTQTRPNPNKNQTSTT